MTAITLAITQPANGQVFTGPPPVAVVLQGAVVPPAPAEVAGLPMYYRWYSSLFPSAENRYSIHPTALNNPATPYSADLRVGTHAITFAASDRSGETKSDQNATQHGGVAGGADGQTACVIHVLSANMIKPTSGALVSKGQPTLEAEAPLMWGRKNITTNAIELNVEYHKINRVGYRWRFTPPAGSSNQPVELALTPAQMVFDPSSTPPVVRYQGALPAGLANGSYTVTLIVEHTEQPKQWFHSISVNVTIGA